MRIAPPHLLPASRRPSSMELACDGQTGASAWEGRRTFAFSHADAIAPEPAGLRPVRTAGALGAPGLRRRRR